MTVDIFADAKEKVVPEWAKFTNAGDAVQGTYVGKILGIIDGYGNEQIIYQLLQEDGRIVNVGFGLNKKVMHADMQVVNFGQIIGFKFKGKITVKDKFGKPVEVKDFAIYQDPKIVNAKWLKENEGNMPVATQAVANPTQDANAEAEKAFQALDKEEDVPFSTPGSLTNADKLVAIEKLAKTKLGAIDAKTVKERVMERTGIAFIPVNYDKILEKLAGEF